MPHIVLIRGTQLQQRQPSSIDGPRRWNTGLGSGSFFSSAQMARTKSCPWPYLDSRPRWRRLNGSAIARAMMIPTARIAIRSASLHFRDRLVSADKPWSFLGSLMGSFLESFFVLWKFNQGFISLLGERSGWLKFGIRSTGTSSGDWSAWKTSIPGNPCSFSDPNTVRGLLASSELFQDVMLKFRYRSRHFQARIIGGGGRGEREGRNNETCGT